MSRTDVVRAAALAATVVGAASGVPVYAFLGSAISGVLNGYAARTELEKQRRAAAAQYTAQITDRTLTIQSPVVARRLCYGRVRLSGVINYISNSGPKQEFLHLQIAMCQGPIDAIERFGIGQGDENTVEVTADGAVNTNPYVRPSKQAHLQTALPASRFIPLPNVSSIVSVSAIGLTFFRDAPLTTVLPASQYTLANGGITITGVGPGKQIVVDYETLEFHSDIRIRHGLGAADQVVDPMLQTECGVPASHRLRGLFYVYARIEASEATVARGLQDFWCDIRGSVVWDLRTDTQVWSDNPVLCILHMLMHPLAGECPAANIDTASWIAAANACDELVPHGDGTMKKRYTLNGVVDLDDNFDVYSTLKSMLTSCAGWMYESAGVWYIHAGVWEPPAVTLPESSIVGGLDISSFDSIGTKCNTVRGTYMSSVAKGQTTDFDEYSAPEYVLEDGRVLAEDLVLPWTNDNQMARRLAKVHMMRSRNSLTVDANFDLRAFALGPAQRVAIDCPAAGWPRKPFIVHKWELKGGVRLFCREDGPEIYDWEFRPQTGVDPTPNTTLPSPTVVLAPTNVRVVTGDEFLVLGRDGSVLIRAKVLWDQPSNPLVGVGGKVELIWKRVGDPVWTTEAALDGEATFAFVSPLRAGEVIQVGVRFRNAVGVVSNWTYSQSTTVSGKTTLPADVDQIRWRDWDSVEWAPVDEDDLAGYRLRYNLGANTSWASAMPLHDGLVGVSPWRFKNRPFGQITVMIKAVDTSGNESLHAATTPANIPKHPDRAVFYERTCRPSDSTLTAGAYLSGGQIVAGQPTLDATGWFVPSPGWTLFVATAWLGFTPWRSGAPYWVEVVPVWEGERIEVRMAMSPSLTPLPISAPFYVPGGLITNQQVEIVVYGSADRPARLKEVYTRSERPPREVHFDFASLTAGTVFGVNALDNCFGFAVSQTGGTAQSVLLTGGSGGTTFPMSGENGFIFGVLPGGSTITGRLTLRGI